jgi:hypothetical protein
MPCINIKRSYGRKKDEYRRSQENNSISSGAY